MLLVLCAWAPTPAPAAETIGADLSTPQDGRVGCTGGANVSCVIAQTALPTRPVASPFDGVVVRIRNRGGLGSARARVLRPGPNGPAFVASTPFAPGDPAGATITYEVRLPVLAGDLIGIEAAPGAQSGYRSRPGARADYFEPAPADGATTAPNFSPADVEFLYNADVEADADGDGFGDETQDLCPTDPKTQEACLAPPRTPEAGRTATVDVVRGRVFVKLPRGRSAVRAAQADASFIALENAAQIPVGSIVDTSDGTVRMTAAAGTGGGTVTGDFTGGVFQLTQQAAASTTTDLVLSGGSFRRCRGTRTVRRLVGTAGRRFRIRGRYSHSTASGARWTHADRCDGTLTTVRSGVVTVRDLVKRRNIKLRRGGRYLARPRRR